jgi:signal peptide peptidase SppA
MNYTRIISAVMTTPWAIRREKLYVIADLVLKRAYGVEMSQDEIALIAEPSRPPYLIECGARADDSELRILPAEFHAGAVPYGSSDGKDDSDTWDGGAARDRLAKWASSDGSGDKDKMDWAKYRRGFGWYDAENAENFGSYKLPHHDIEGAKFVVVWGGVRAAMSALLGSRGGADIPAGDRKAVYNHLAKHYKEFDKEPPDFHSEGFIIHPFAKIQDQCDCMCDACMSGNCADCSHDGCTCAGCEMEQAKAKAKGKAQGDQPCECPCDPCIAGDCEDCDHEGCDCEGCTCPAAVEQQDEHERKAKRAKSALLATNGGTVSRSSAPVIAVLPLFGTIAHRMGMFSDMSGGTSTERFQQYLRSAVGDPTVKSIVIDIDSPGGTVNGVPELADEIYQARDVKPVVAIANSQAASAAYYLASQASDVVAIPSGEVGSIGVFAAHEDISKAAENQGVKVSLISAGKYKTEANPFEPLSEEARAALQDKVNNFYDMFVNAVARGRNTSPDAVRNGMGQGRMLQAEQARRTGMVDRVATFDRTLKRLGAKMKPPQPTPDRLKQGATPIPAHVLKLRRLRREMDLY